MSFEGNYYEACKRIGVLEQQLADMTADYHRWHQAYCDAKYPESVPLSWQQTAEALKVSQAAIKRIDFELEKSHDSGNASARIRAARKIIAGCFTRDAGAKP